MRLRYFRAERIGLLDALLDIQLALTRLIHLYIFGGNFHISPLYGKTFIRFSVRYLQGYEAWGASSRSGISMCQLVNKGKPEMEERLELLSPFIAFECWLNWRSISWASPKLSRCLESMNSLGYGASLRLLEQPELARKKARRMADLVLKKKKHTMLFLSMSVSCSPCEFQSIVRFLWHKLRWCILCSLRTENWEKSQVRDGELATLS